MKKYNRNNNFFIIILLIILILFFLLLNNKSCYENFEVTNNPIELNLDREIHVKDVSSNLNTEGADENTANNMINDPELIDSRNNLNNKLNK